MYGGEQDRAGLWGPGHGEPRKGFEQKAQDPIWVRGHRGSGQLCFKVREDLLEEGSPQEEPIRGRALQAEGTAGAKPRSSKAHDVAGEP